MNLRNTCFVGTVSWWWKLGGGVVERGINTRDVLNQEIKISIPTPIK